MNTKLHDQLIDVLMAWPDLRLSTGSRARLAATLAEIAERDQDRARDPIAKPTIEGQGIYESILTKLAIGGSRGTVTGTRWYTLAQQEKLAREIADHVEQAVVECAKTVIGEGLAANPFLQPKPTEPRWCAWCNRPENNHNVRHPFQARPAGAAVRAAASADKAVATPSRCHRVFKHSARIGDAMIPDGARCTKPADGHGPSECVFNAPGQLERDLKGTTIIALDPGQSDTGALRYALIAAARGEPAVMQRDTYEMPREHANPPPGFLPCSRPTPHQGPCAHPPNVNYRWVGESLPDPEPLPPPPKVNLFSTAETRQRALMTAVSRAVHEYKLETGHTVLAMVPSVLDALEDKTAGFLIASDLTGEPQPTEVDIDCKNARDRVNRVIRVRGLGVEIRFPPTYGDLWHAANLGEKMAERAHHAKLPPITPIASTQASTQRCAGGCSRGGEGPACGKSGCCCG